jgi:hypothetical protein
MMVAAQHAVAQHLAECTATQVGVRLGRGEGAAGTIYYAIVFTNRSARSCSLRGYPGVSSVGGADGHQIGAPARRAPAKIVRVVLRPGGTASAAYGQAEALNFPRARCHPAKARGLRVYAPDQTRARYLPLAHLACSSTGLGDSSISAVVPGSTGMPT